MDLKQININMIICLKKEFQYIFFLEIMT